MPQPNTVFTCAPSISFSARRALANRHGDDASSFVSVALDMLMVQTSPRPTRAQVRQPGARA